ncbi:transposase, partial [Hoeflea sp.]|uniref:transposase n=1 Tax=Hoeflea sp. TaxID=1940281 RepID=UPI00199C88FE
MMNGVVAVADGIEKEFQRLLPRQRVTQRRNLALLIATMLDVRSANLMDLAASLPRAAERIDMRFQWIWRVLMNPLIDPDAVMAPFAREVMERLSGAGEPLVLVMDQSKINARHHMLMLALRFGERALPLMWRVEATEGAIGFATQEALLQAVLPLLPEGARICLMADRFYGTADLIGLVQRLGWDYRIRLKGNLIVDYGTGRCATGELAADRVSAIENVKLTRRGIITNIGIIHDPGHEEPWIVAMSARPGYLSTLDYSCRWAIEPMFSDFKSRGFGLEDTQIQYPDRLARLILVIALALYFAVSTGRWDAKTNP